MVTIIPSEMVVSWDYIAEGYFFCFFFGPGSWWLRGFCGFYGPVSWWLLVAFVASAASVASMASMAPGSYGSSIIYRSIYQ